MSIKKTQINIINNPNKSFVHSSFIENKGENKNIGDIFIVAEVNQANKVSDKIIFIIEKMLEKNYYFDNKLLLSNNINSLKIESLFEASLVKTNQDLLEFIDQEKINFDFNSLNISVGLLYNEQIFFSNLGQNKSFLIRQNENSYDISDINPEDEKTYSDDLNSGKIFSSIISGEMPDKSFLIFTNASLGQYILNENFIRILNDLKLEGATEQIKNLLKDINNYSNFSGLIIKKIDQESYQIQNNNDLIEAEKRTEKLLTDSGDLNKKKIGKKIKKILSKVLKKIGILFSRIIKKTKKEKKALEDNNIIVEKKGSRIKKTLIIVLTLLLITLIISFSLKKRGQETLLIEEQVNNHSEIIDRKLRQVDDALLYNNESRAKEIIEELNIIFSELSQKEKNKIKNFNELEERLKKQLLKIRKINKVSEMNLIADFSHLNNDIKVGPLTKNSNKLYLGDENNGLIYYSNLENEALGQVNLELSPGPFLSKKINKDIYWLTKDKVLIMNQEEQISSLEINSLEMKNILSFDIYNNRVYLLDKSEKQIFRYNRGGSEFSGPSPWIKDDYEINPLAMVIDYDIYLLDDKGIINRYNQGYRDKNFQSEIIDPPINKAKDIKLSKKHFLILDEGENRLIVFLRDSGVFLKQYYFENNGKIKSFALDENELTVYLVNEDAQVYKFDLDL